METNQEWESLCKRCGKCCHIKHDFIIYALADPERVCKHLNEDNTCSIYAKRLTSRCNCMALKDAIKKTGLLPADCGYFHLNPDHTPLIIPASMEEFWKLVKVAENFLNRKFSKNVDLVSAIMKDRDKNKSYKSKRIKWREQKEFMNTCIYTIFMVIMDVVYADKLLMSYLQLKKKKLKT